VLRFRLIISKQVVSIRKITSKNPDYSLRTLQPLTPFDDDATELTFVQAQLSSGENFGDRRNTFNLGVGYRQLLEQGQSIAFIGFLVNATFDIADGLVFKLTFNTGGNFITKLAGVV
jgi:hypothetical protein